MARCIFFQPSIAPYRVGLFNKLNEVFDIQVIFSELHAENRRWDKYKNYIKFNYATLGCWKVRTGRFQIFIPNLFKLGFIKSADKVIISTNFSDILISICVLVACRIYKKKVLCWITIYDKYKIIPSKNWLSFLINKLFYELASLLVFFSDKCIGYSSKSCAISIHLNKECAHSSQYYPFELEYGLSTYDKKPTVSNKKIRVLIISYISKRKNIEMALRLAASYEDKLDLTIAGISTDENYYKKLQRLSSLNVDFVGMVDPKMKKALFETHDVLLFTTNKDSWGYVVNEALFFKVPVVGSIHAMASLDLIKDGQNGYQFGTYTELSEIFSRINRDRIQQMSRNIGSAMVEFNDAVLHNFYTVLK